MDLDAVLARRPTRRAGRRTRAHEHARDAPREAVAGRRGAPRRRHRRHLHGEHPAPRVAQRRGRADHRRRPARDRARRIRAAGRSDRAGRHEPGGAAPADGARQHLPGREGRCRARELLPTRQPGRAPRAGAAVGGRSGGGDRCRATSATTASPPRGRPASEWSWRSPAPTGASTSSAARHAWPGDWAAT